MKRLLFGFTMMSTVSVLLAQNAAPAATPAVAPTATPAVAATPAPAKGSLKATDGGVQAVQAGQEATPAVPGKEVNAKKILMNELKKRNWNQGWDETSKRIIEIEAADFKTLNPAEDSAFFVKREMAAKKAILMAKAKISEAVNQDMEALDNLAKPGTDINKKLGTERERIKAEILQEQEALARQLEKVNQAEAAVLRGTTLDERFDDLISALITKLDEKYDASKHDQAAQARYATAKAKLVDLQTQYTALIEKAKGMLKEPTGTQESFVTSFSRMPLYGCSTIMQTESWSKKSGLYQVAVMVCWSPVLERAARAVVLGEDYRIKPAPSAKSLSDWLAGQNLAVMIGPRQYVDNTGKRWFLGISARPYGEDLTSDQRESNKDIAEMYAKQMTIFSLYADVESYKQAHSLQEQNGDNIVAAEEMAKNLTQSFQSRKVRGLHEIPVENEIKHPITGDTIYVSVFAINEDAAKMALEVEKMNYATKVMDEHHQTVERGRDAANQQAVEQSKNRPEDFQKGFNQQSAAVQGEIQAREGGGQKQGGVSVLEKDAGTVPVVAPKQQKKSTGGAFGGDSGVNDDF